MIRVVFRAHDNGQEFPVYFTSADEIEEAAQKLNAVEIRRDESSEDRLRLEQLMTLLGLKP